MKALATALPINRLKEILMARSRASMYFILAAVLIVGGGVLTGCSQPAADTPKPVAAAPPPGSPAASPQATQAREDRANAARSMGRKRAELRQHSKPGQ